MHTPRDIAIIDLNDMVELTYWTVILYEGANGFHVKVRKGKLAAEGHRPRMVDPTLEIKEYGWQFFSSAYAFFMSCVEIYKESIARNMLIREGILENPTLTTPPTP